LTARKSGVVVITGSTRGIGRAIAEACAKAGYKVVISSRKTENVKQAIVDFRSAGLEVSGIAVDVASAEDLERLKEFALQTYGSIDVWINNAGISGGYRTIQEMKPEEIQEVIDTNLTGTFNACRLLIPYFRERGGMILNLSGRGGSGKAAPYQAPYAATKAAVMSLTLSLAAENKNYKISINCVMPGMVATDMFENVVTCPETERQMSILPVILKSFASPIQDVQKLFVELCAQEPGKHTGRCYSAEKPRRYLRALAATPDFIRVARQMRRGQVDRAK
jgi:glucose 1-dehydrogenase